MLHHPFRRMEDLLYIEGLHDEPCTTYFEAYEACRERCFHEPDGYNDPLPEPEESVFEPTPQDPDEDAQNNMEPEWAELACQLPDLNGRNADGWDQLGYRPMDRVDWTDRVGKYPDLRADWWKDQKVNCPVVVQGHATTDYQSLEAKQKLTYDTFVTHWKDVVYGFNPVQLLLHLDGKAGTGKTTVVESMCSEVERIAWNNGRSSPILRAAPTGVAACNFGGSTLHSLFRFSVKEKSYQPLAPAHLKALQAKFKDIVYLIIDEKSMVSIKMLTYIYRRFREIFPARCTEDFAGMSIIIAGDFFQLPPVGERALYITTKSLSTDVILSQQIYRRFNRTITLNVIKRQTGEDRES
jgi:hypothetical protein